LLKTS